MKVYNCQKHGEQASPIEMVASGVSVFYCPHDECDLKVVFIGVKDDPVDLRQIERSIRRLEGEFSPENLSCDGQLTGVALTEKYDALLRKRDRYIAEWEKGAGRSLLVQDLYLNDHYLKNTNTEFWGKYAKDTRVYKSTKPSDFT